MGMKARRVLRRTRDAAASALAFLDPPSIEHDVGAMRSPR
jgi:hypothetical protein